MTKQPSQKYNRRRHVLLLPIRSTKLLSCSVTSRAIQMDFVTVILRVLLVSLGYNATDYSPAKPKVTPSYQEVMYLPEYHPRSEQMASLPMESGQLSSTWQHRMSEIEPFDSEGQSIEDEPEPEDGSVTGSDSLNPAEVRSAFRENMLDKSPAPPLVLSNCAK